MHNFFMPATLTKSFRTILVDLLPMLPGGENGGAKIFIIELLRTLSRLMPDTQFVLLTRRSSHNELAALDCANVTRRLILEDIVAVGQPVPNDGSFSRSTLLRPARTFLQRMHDVLWNRRIPLPTKVSKRRNSDQLVKEINADLFFCPFTGSSFFHLAIPTVVIVYDLQHTAYPQFFSNRELRQRNENFRKSCTKSAVVTISEYVRSSVVGLEFVDPSVVFPIHIRTTARLPEIDREQQTRVLQKLGIEPHNYFLYPANFWPHKNHEMLLTAFAIARTRGLPRETKLVCSGASVGKKRDIAAAAARLELGNVALFPGFLDDTEFSAVMRSAFAVIFPSLYEGFGMPVVEAMAAGCPVACSNLTSLPEVAGNAALLFDPRRPEDIAQAMLRLYRDSRLRTKLIERGTIRAKTFADIDHMAREYIDVFKFAITHKHANVGVFGIYNDGWAGQHIFIRYASGGPIRFVEVELHSPQWLPIRRSNVTTLSAENAKPFTHTMVRGASTQIRVRIDAEPGELEIRITPSFNPAQRGLSDDQRDLALIVLAVTVREGDEAFVMFPPPFRAKLA